MDENWIFSFTLEMERDKLLMEQWIEKNIPKVAIEKNEKINPLPKKNKARSRMPFSIQDIPLIREYLDNSNQCELDFN